MNTPVQENVAEAPKKGNGLTIAGFILAIVSIIICWFPLIGWLCWITATLAIIFCIIGLIKKQKKGLAITGIILGAASFVIYYIMVAAANDALMNLNY